MSTMFSKMVTFLSPSYFGSLFATIAKAKVKSTLDFYTLAIILIMYKKILVKQFLLFFSLIGWGDKVAP